jgi:hypothetical protein
MYALVPNGGCSKTHKILRAFKSCCDECGSTVAEEQERVPPSYIRAAVHMRTALLGALLAMQQVETGARTCSRVCSSGLKLT